MRDLVPGVRDVQLGGVSRTGPTMYVAAFLVDVERPTLVDTGWADTTTDLLAALDDAGVVPERVVLTHDGRDHYGGLDAVMAAFDPELVVPADETALRDAIDHEPDRYVADGDAVGPMEVYVLPGHSAALASLYLPDERTLIAADALDGSDRRGLPAGYLLPPPPAYNDHPAVVEDHLLRLLELDLDSVLVSHGSHVLGDAGAKLERLLRFQPQYEEPGGVVGTHPSAAD
jgi:glyoxylase-like metal-dependent hydrolase (beta-lactamase superfamily II)